VLKKTFAALLASAFGAAAVQAEHHRHDADAGGAPTDAREVYRIDPAHSSVNFAIRHFFSDVTGSFTEFEGTIRVDRDNLENSHARAVIRVPSVDTNKDKRDSHLQEEEYFNASEHQRIVFESKEWRRTGENRFDVVGDLTIRGITREVTLDARLLGFGQGRGDDYLSGWKATASLDRTEFNVSGGQPAVGAEVDVTVNVEAQRVEK